jgi:conjugative relaxase-like TrwC/TraI family protein
MAWVTVIGPSDAQVAYRLSAQSGCSRGDAPQVQAAPLVAAIEAKAGQQGVTADDLLRSNRQRAMFTEAAEQVGRQGAGYAMNAADALRLATAAGLDINVVFGPEDRAVLAGQADAQVAYRVGGNERPLRWIGEGCREFGIEPWSELAGEQLDWARDIMRGYHPHSGEQLLTPKTARDPRGKLPAVPLLHAIGQRADDLGVPVTALLDSERKRDAYARMERQVQRFGETHRVAVTDVVKLADAAGADVRALYGEEAFTEALRHEHDEVVIGNRGYDLTINLPKPFSILFAYGQGAFAAELEDVFMQALKETVAAGEGWTAYGMRGHHSAEKSAEREDATGWIGWVNLHRAARPVGNAPFGDPHLHAHVVIANLVRGKTDGKWSTVAAGGRDLHRHASALDALMQARVRHLTHQRWGIEWARNARTGVWHIVGIPESTVRLFSKRGAQVDDLFKALGLPKSEATAVQQHTAAALIKEAKPRDAANASDDAIRTYWRNEAEVAGEDPDRTVHESLHPDTCPPQRRVPSIPAPADLDEVCRWVFRVDGGLTSHRKDFTRAHALAAAGDALRNGVASTTNVEDLTDQIIAHGGFTIPLKSRGGTHLSNNQRYTTADILDAEHAIIHHTRTRFGEGTAVVDDHTLRMAIGTYQAMRNPGFALSDEQLAVLTRITQAGHGIDAVIGVAGAGKTTLMEAARLAFQASGLTVAGASTAAVAAANLRLDTGIPARTVASWLASINTGGQGLTGVDVLVLDEAAMCDDRDTAALLDHTAATGTKVIGIGDPKQLHSPGVGGSFAAVHTLVGGHTLTVNYRQTDHVERRALELWRDNHYREALAAWAGHGRVHAAATRDEALAALLATWDTKRRAYADPYDAIDGVAILAGLNTDVDELNIAAQAIRHHTGELHPTPTTYDLLGGGTATFHIGDTVLIRKNDYRAWRTDGTHADLLNGHRGLITAIDTHRNMQIEWRTPGPDGTPRTLREWVTPEYVAAEGVTLGYAMTVHKTQGTTVDVALIYGTALAPNALYTALSRDRHEAHLYLPRDLLETTADQATLGEPETAEAELDRVLTYLANTLTHNTEQALITEELEGPIQPITTKDPTSQDATLTDWLTTHNGPATEHRRATGPSTETNPAEATIATLTNTAGLITTERPHEPAPRSEPQRHPRTAAPAHLTDTQLAEQITTTSQTLAHLINALDSDPDLQTEARRLTTRLTNLRAEADHRRQPGPPMARSQPQPSTYNEEHERDQQRGESVDDDQERGTSY